MLNADLHGAEESDVYWLPFSNDRHEDHPDTEWQRCRSESADDGDARAIFWASPWCHSLIQDYSHEFHNANPNLSTLRPANSDVLS